MKSRAGPGQQGDSARRTALICNGVKKTAGNNSGNVYIVKTQCIALASDMENHLEFRGSALESENFYCHQERPGD